MKSFLYISFFVVVFLSLSSCKCKTPKAEEIKTTEEIQTPIKPSDSVGFTLLLSGGHSSVSVENQRIVKDKETLEQVYKQINQTLFPPIEVPNIDFDKEVLLALYMGEKSTGGYSIAVDHISISESELRVFYHEKSPKGLATAVLTQPFCLVKIASTSLPIHFQKL